MVGIIGMGVFGRFMAEQLAPYLDVVVWSRTKRDAPGGTRWADLEEVAAQPVVIVSVTVQAMEETLKRIAPHLRPGALVADVASVKTVPVQIMQQYVPKHAEVLATHPVFGPQSGAKGIAGLKVVVWPVRIKHERYEAVQRFLREQLKLEVAEMAPEEHDREMAYVQALTFLIGRALGAMDIPEARLTVPKYEYLREIKKIVAGDTPELFETIQRYNPYAAEVRQRFERELDNIELRLRA